MRAPATLDQPNDQKLTDAILDHLARYAPDGESVSFLQTTLRQEGWRYLGNLADFCTLCERLGFRVLPGKRKYTHIVAL